jgi:TolA-binding protein
MGVALASALIASSLYLRSVNYGPGGDEKFYQVGLQQEKERDLNAALESFAKVTQRYPRSPRAPQAHRKMSEVYHKKGDLTKASQALRESLWSQSHLVSHATHEWNQDEKNFRWQNHFMLGEISMAEKAWGTASDWYQQLIDENASPSIFQKALYRYGDALYQKSDKAERNSIEMRDLIEAYERAIEASPEAKWNAPSLFRLAELWEDLAGHEVGFRKENLGKALDYMKRLEQKGERLPLEGIDPLKVQLSMGRLYRDLGEVESSIGLYRGLLAQPKDPLEDTPLPLDVMGGLARSLLTRAEQYAKEAQSASAETDLYEVLEISRAFDEEQPTKRTSEQSDETAPIGIVESLYLRGHANYQLGVLKAGQTDKGPNGYFEKMDLAYQAALARNDHYGLRGIDSLLAMLRRTNFEFQINQDYHAAVRAYTRILEQFPASIYAYRIRHRLGTAQFHLGEYAEAEVQFRQVVDQFSLTRYVDDQAFRDSYFRLGHCQFLMKEYLRAADTIKTLLQLIDYEETPEALSAWRLLAEAYYSQGLYDQAIEEYRNYLTRYPAQDQEGKIRLALGRTLISRFDYEEGRKELQKIIDQQSEGRATSALYQSARMARYFICESYLTEFNLAPGNSRGALLSKALYEANNLRSAFPAEDTPLHLLGRVHFLMGDFERAVRDLEYFCNSAQGQRPLATAQLLLGESYFNLKRYNKAAEVLARLEVSELPREEGARTLYLLAESQRFEKQFQNAADTYNRLAKDYPASTYSELVQGRIEEVLWRLRKGI